MYAETIIKTLNDYFGELRVDEEKRLSLLAQSWDKDNQPIKTSIRNLKDQNCAACVERASLSHNFWLMAGAQSFYVSSRRINHAFNVWTTGKNANLFDATQHNFGLFPKDWKEKVFNDEYLRFGNFVYSGKNKEPIVLK